MFRPRTLEFMKKSIEKEIADKKQFDDKDEEGELFAPDNEDYDPSSSKDTDEDIVTDTPTKKQGKVDETSDRESYLQHLKRKEAARNWRDEDKETIRKDPKVIAFNFDLQAVLNTPKGTVTPKRTGANRTFTGVRCGSGFDSIREHLRMGVTPE
ncbi:hypothetical protein LSTR_LSTR011945 [Laodelphax striatellus]|uniref:Uncharacterized protein n=1 Tax=Laodelphax striatellus TaxID=195883 RepID=A0A482WY50_LAOST|nr:hypothetical protein LSTR_LSTR011945 [Laodelphax striatellus]